MFRNTKPKSNPKPVFASDVYPDGKPMKKPKETLPRSLMNYDIIRDKVQNDMQPKPTPQIAEGKQAGGKKKLLNF